MEEEPLEAVIADGAVLESSFSASYSYWPSSDVADHCLDGGVAPVDEAVAIVDVAVATAIRAGNLLYTTTYWKGFKFVEKKEALTGEPNGWACRCNIADHNPKGQKACNRSMQWGGRRGGRLAVEQQLKWWAMSGFFCADEA